jgi:hypothetical protein
MKHNTKEDGKEEEEKPKGPERKGKAKGPKGPQEAYPIQIPSPSFIRVKSGNRGKEVGNGKEKKPGFGFLGESKRGIE